MRPDYCPMTNHPCMCMCEKQCSAHRLKVDYQDEPIAWMVYTLDGKSVLVTDSPDDFTSSHKVLPLYTSPQGQKK